MYEASRFLLYDSLFIDTSIGKRYFPIVLSSAQARKQIAQSAHIIGSIILLFEIHFKQREAVFLRSHLVRIFAYAIAGDIPFLIHLNSTIYSTSGKLFNMTFFHSDWNIKLHYFPLFPNIHACLSFASVNHESTLLCFYSLREKERT